MIGQPVGDVGPRDVVEAVVADAALGEAPAQVGLVVAQDVDAEAAGRRHRLPRVAGDLREEADERRVERHRRERPDREPGRVVAGPAGDDRDAGREVAEHLAELVAVERRWPRRSGSAVIDVDGRHGRATLTPCRSTVADAKRALRAEMREVRRRIAADPADRLARSARASGRGSSTADLGAARRPGVGTIAPRRVGMLFESLPTEPDTAAWIDVVPAAGFAVFTPEVDGPDLRVVPGDVDPATLDVVRRARPGVHRRRRRLGQGGGHFDRFLPAPAPDCVTIGVGFAEQLVDDLPTEPHDVHLTHVVTDA